MNFEFILGIIISVLLTIWGIWHSNKYRTKSNLTLIDREKISIIDTYDDKEKILERINYTIPFNSNQYYYRGTIINTGNTDIYKNIILKPLKISFPKDAKILNFNIIKAESKIDTNFKLESNCVIVEWDILKPLEHFSFEMIYETSKNESNTKEKTFSLNYRIADLKEIERISLWGLNDIKNKNIIGEHLPNYLAFSFAIAISIFLFFSGVKSFKQESGYIKPLISRIGTKGEVEVKYFSQDSLELTYDDKIEIIAIKDLNKKLDVKINKTVHKNRYWLTIISGIFTFIIIPLGFYKTINTQIRDFRLKKVIKFI